MAEKLCLKVCQHFRHEMEGLAGEQDFAGILTSTYPLFCEHPQKDPDWQQAVAGQAEKDCQVVLVGGCFLGTGKVSISTTQVTISKLDQCFYMIAARSMVDQYMRESAYLLTPGWLEEWPRWIEQWKFDQATAREFFAESVTKLVLLDTGVDAESPRRLQELAAYLDLPCESIPVGLDYFRLFMSHLIGELRQDQSSREIKLATAQADKKTADYSMAFDLLANLTEMRAEADVARGIMETFAMLFAAKKLIYVSVRDNQLDSPLACQASQAELSALQTWLSGSSEEYLWMPEKKSFRLRLKHQGVIVSVLEVSELVFPEYMQQYLNLALAMAHLCGMAVVNARLFQQVQVSADTDALTGLFNRRYFFRLGETEWQRSKRYDRPLSAIMFDVDHFKQVNDTHGHIAGDHLLIAVTNDCSKVLRKIDTLCRYGGEEFIVLLPETSLPHALQAAERLRNSVAKKPFECDGNMLKITISLGVAVLDPGCASLDELIHRCDEALYQAKDGGRNRIQAWES